MADHRMSPSHEPTGPVESPVPGQQARRVREAARGNGPVERPQPRLGPTSPGVRAARQAVVVEAAATNRHRIANRNQDTDGSPLAVAALIALVPQGIPERVETEMDIVFSHVCLRQ